jgi:DNA invertase Pin-like site-specific DNA recombinase
MTPAPHTPAVIYCRVSTDKQGENGLGMEAQAAACIAECERRGWGAITMFQEVTSAKGPKPELDNAKRIAKEHGAVLVVAKDDRASRSTIETLLLHDQAAKEGWHFFACNMPNVDTTTPDGRFMATMFAAFAELERGRISDRTKAALAAKKARGETLGRPRRLDALTQDVIRFGRESGQSYEAIAVALNAQGVRGPQGGLWYKQTVRDACKRYGLEEAA